MAKKKSKISVNEIIAGGILLGTAILAFKKPTASVGAKKYNYELVLQSNHGFGWDDEISVDTDSSGFITDPQERAAWKENKKLYKENVKVPIRVISRRTKK